MSYIYINITLLTSSIFFYLFHKENIFRKIVLYDFPDNKRKIHIKPTPLIGGFLIFKFLLFNLIYLFFEKEINIKTFLIFVPLFTLFFCLGFIDDKDQISPKIKSFIIFFLLLIFLPLDQNFLIKNLYLIDLNLLINLNQGSLFFTVLCIYFFYNFLNFSDGANGIACSLSIFWLLFIYLNGGFPSKLIISILIILILLLILNINKKIFLGNSGSSLLSILISSLLIINYNNSSLISDDIVLVMFLPALDALRISIERIINNKSPYLPDKKHFHHLLMNVISKNYIFIPYIIFAISPYFLSKLIKSHYSLIISSILYFLIIFFLRKKN